MTTEPENKAKIKARELVEVFEPFVECETINGYLEEMRKEYAAKCALICCDEIISELEDVHNLLMTPAHGIAYTNVVELREFWQQVKAEVEKL